MKKIFLGALVLVAFVLLTVAVVKKCSTSQTHDEGTPAATSTSFKSDDLTRGASSPDLDHEVEPPQSKGYAKRIAHVPPKDTDGLLSEPNSETEYLKIVLDTIEAALSGNAGEAIQMSHLLNSCSLVFETESTVKRYIAITSELHQGGGDQPTFNGGDMLFIHPGGEFSNATEYELAVWEQYHLCQTAMPLFSEDLRERIFSLAEAGIPTARYLYAMWPPIHDKYGKVDLQEDLYYQSRALEYTMLNVDEREPLGVLAFGNSYTHQQPGLFTPYNSGRGNHFLIAAQKCGLTSIWLDYKVNVIVDKWASLIDGGYYTLEQLIAPSNEIKALFCN